MTLDVYVRGRLVAKLDHTRGDEHALTYLPGTASEDFVSLTMPVRTASWVWRAGLHPFFQMNLPEGYLLSVIRELTGALLDGRDITLLGVVGRNAIGRVQVVREGEPLDVVMPGFDPDQVLRGENTEEAFVALIRKHAYSGVSGILPKFLAPPEAGGDDAEAPRFTKASVRTGRYLVKGVAGRYPGVAVNEWVCLQAARRAGLETAHGTLSEDGQVLVVERFDVDAEGRPQLGMEDLCSLLGLRPAEKYDSTWERVADALRDVVTGAEPQQRELEKLLRLVVFCLMTRNADCHTKNVAVVYSTADDVRLSPVYDVFTTAVYDDARFNNFSLSIAGSKSWSPGKRLTAFAQQRCGVSAKALAALVSETAQALIDTLPDLVRLIRGYPHFETIGKRMLGAWRDAMDGLLREKSPGNRIARLIEDERFSDPPRPKKAGSLGGSVMPLKPKA